MKYSFSKYFGVYKLENCDYYVCTNCGFGASKTHFELSNTEWEELNFEWHEDNNERIDNPYNRNQRYFNQAILVSLLLRHEFLGGSKILDWASGKGSVSALAESFFGVVVKNYDKYITPDLNQISENELKDNWYDLVINCALFEHVRDRETLDQINNLVSDNGAFAIHTLVPDKVPKDPDWMYLLPVHCSFHTNKSMQILMDDWGFKSSIYNLDSKMWVLFKKEPKHISMLTDKVNDLLGWKFLHFKEGFVDYWK